MRIHAIPSSLYWDVLNGVREMADGHFTRVTSKKLQETCEALCACASGPGEVDKDSPLKETKRGFTK